MAENEVLSLFLEKYLDLFPSCSTSQDITLLFITAFLFLSQEPAAGSHRDARRGQENVLQPQDIVCVSSWFSSMHMPLPSTVHLQLCSVICLHPLSKK